MIALTSLSFAQTSVKLQEKRIDSLNDISYEIKMAKSQSELARIKKECQANNGCLEGVVEPVLMVEIEQKNSNPEPGVGTPKKLTNITKILKTLSINAIINKRVIFDKMEGYFEVGDTLYPNIKIKDITSSTVTLVTKDGVVKTLIMDWVID